jgi:hypothetical protein
MTQLTSTGRQHVTYLRDSCPALLLYSTLDGIAAPEASGGESLSYCYIRQLVRHPGSCN